jgi:hypothetical protein
MREAQRICFIGFGYDNTNLERLFGGGVGPLRDVFGSAKGLSEQECVLIKGKLRTLVARPGLLFSRPTAMPLISCTIIVHWTSCRLAPRG